MTTTGTMQRPQYDVELSDGSSTLGFKVTDSNGQEDPRRFTPRPQERSAIQTVIGESTYSDRRPPWRDIAQEDFSGGGGMLEFDKDKTRYWNSQNVQTTKGGQIILAGKATQSKAFSSGYGKMFEYKRCLYAVNIIDGANSILWRNGDRGAADSNTGVLTTLVDATKSWTPDEHIGAVVLIIRGPGSEETQPWRSITDNDATTLTVSPAWSVTHTTSTEYVIVNSDKWTQVLDLGGHVTSFTVADEFVYFARGETASLNVLRYNEYNLGGVWTVRNAAEGMMATHVVAMRNEVENTTYLYGARNASDPYKVTLWKMRVPATWEALYKDLGTMCDTNIPWSDRIITNSTNTTLDGATKIALAAGFTTGVAAVRNLPEPVNITGANAIGALIRSSVATASGDLKLYFEDTPDLGRSYYTPGMIYHVDPDQNPRIVPLYFAGDGDTATIERIIPGFDIYIGSIRQFNMIYVDVQTANTVASTVSCDVYIGQWNAATVVSDGTASGGATFAVDGTIEISYDAHWKAHSYNGQSLYWARLKFSSPLSSNTEVTQIKVRRDTIYQPPQAGAHYDYNTTTYTGISSLIDFNDATYQTIALTDNLDGLYIGSSTPFDRVYFNINTANTGVETLKMGYYGSGGFKALTISDGTVSAGASWAVDGTVTWTMPDDWVPMVISGTGYGSTSALYYVVFYVDTADPDVSASLIDIGVGNYYTGPINNDPDALALVDTSGLAYYYQPFYWMDADASTSESIYFKTDQYIYVGGSMIFNKLYVDIATANTASATLTAEYFDGSLWTSIAITDATSSTGKTFAVDGDISWSPQNDWQTCIVNEQDLYWIRFDTSANITFAVNEMRYARSNNITVTVPALAANTWTWINVAMTPTALPIPDETSIKSVGLYVAVDNGAQTVELLDGIRLLYSYTTTAEIKLDGAAPINNLAVYNSEETGRAAKVWAITQDGIQEVQDDDAVVKLPLSELKELSSERTGTAWATNGVYLYFNLAGLKVERYYNKNLDDTGPDGDDGLPSDRTGDVSAIMSYPGQVWIAIDGGASNYSSIMTQQGGGWHSYYVSGSTGQRIRDLINQETRSKGWSRLWFSEGVNIKWMPVSTNPAGSTDFSYCSDGYLITGWVYANAKDIIKLFKSIKIFGEGFDSDTYVQVSYMVDGATAWTAISGNFDTVPSEEIALAATYPTGKRIRFKIALHTDDVYETPKVVAWLLNSYGIVPVKYEYDFSTVLEDDYLYVDLNADFKKAWNYATTSVAAWNILKGWTDAATPLTMRTRNTLFDNVTVVAQASMPVAMDMPGPELKKNTERYLVNVSLIDV